MSVQFSIRGLSQLKIKFANAAAKARPVMQADLMKFGQLVMNDAKERYVPVDEGTLQDSGKVEADVSPFSGATVGVRLSFGGAASAYAIAIHELPNYNPPSWGNRTNLNWTKAGTGAKYLELPVMAHSKDLPNVAAKVWVHLWTGVV